MKSSRSLVAATLLAVLASAPAVMAQIRPNGPILRTPGARPLGPAASGTSGGSAAPFPTALPPPPVPASPFKPSDGSDGAPAKPGDKTPAEAALAPRPINGGVTIGLQEADLPELVNWIGSLTGKRFIYGAKVRAIKVTLYSPTPVTVAEAYKAFLVALETNGLTVIPHGRFLKIVETTGGVVTHTTPIYGSAEPVPQEDRYITRLYRLQHVGAEEVNTLLTKFKTKEGDISVYGPGNLLILTDTGTNIRRMLHIVEEIDVGTAGDQIWIEQVNYGTASDFVTRLNDIFDIKPGSAPAAGAGKGGAPTPSDTRVTKIIADDRSNSLIIVATERAYLKILEVIKRLDAPISGEGEIHVLALQHAMAEELAPVLNQIIGGAGARPATGGAGATGARPAGGGAAGALPSGILEGGVRIVADKATNSIVITSSVRDYGQIRSVIDKLDMPRRQVFIEAVIMDMSVDHSTKLGLNYHAGAAPDLGGSSNSLVYGGFNPLNSIALPDPNNLQGLAHGVRGPGLDGSTNLLGTGLTVPAFGIVMNALATSGDANILATPHIIATDNVVAEINVGENIPLQTNVGGGLSSLAGLAGGGAAGALGALGGGLGGFGAAPRQDVGTKIKVTPHMNDSNEVRLELQEEISERGASAGALGVVSITKRTANTSVVVQDQQTVVIGGLMRDAVTKSRQKVPILGDIPVIGFLFRSSETSKRKTNLLLVLTPYVIRDQNDLRTVFERKMQERQEFLDRYFVFSDQTSYEPPRDFARLNGLLEEIRQAYITVDDKKRLADSTKRPDRKVHEPGQPLSMPEIIRAPGSTAAGGAADPGAPHTATEPPRIGRPPGPNVLTPGTRSVPGPSPGSNPGPLPTPGGAPAGGTGPAPQLGFGIMQEQRFLGEVLVRRGVLTLERLETLFQVQRERGLELRELVTSTNVADDATVARALAAEAGLPFVEKIDVAAIPTAIGSRLPISYSKARRVLVFDESDTVVRVLVADPFDISSIDDVRALTQKTPEVSVATGEAIVDAINRVYERGDQGTGELQTEGENVEEELEDILDSDDEAPIIRWVNGLFFNAVKERASDIHIEPEEREVLVRYRIDGELYVSKRANKQFMSSIVARIKIMSGLNIAEKRLPQDGRIGMKIAGNSIDVRVSTIPTSRGFERIVMRLLMKTNVLLDLTDLGFSQRDFGLMSELIRRPDGIILVTGPTGSGKTTTLYACLNKINQPNLNILTAEDPVEYEIGGIHQLHVQPKIGLTFASALRAFLRQDPDVVMVGEIRDKETVDIAINASLTGHLVLSTIHTNDAAGAITRMVDMGVEPFLIRSSVIGILAQRLVRVLCKQCKEPGIASEFELAQLGIDSERTKQRRARKVSPKYVPQGIDYTPVGTLEGEEVKVFRAKGCDVCLGTGYTGRRGIYELLIMDDTIGPLVLRNADAQTVKRTAMGVGMDSLRDDGARKVLLGLTTVEEVLAATQEDAVIE